MATDDHDGDDEHGDGADDDHGPKRIEWSSTTRRQQREETTAWIGSGLKSMQAEAYN